MARLIDADKLKQHYAWWHCVDANMNPGLREYANTFDTIIDLQPTAETVKRGNWIEHGQYKDYVALHILQCSICGGFIVVGNDVDRYCKWCGARMDNDA